ncbi:MAG: hypothetical protein WD939_08615, partial [Dehalococcoidia bacterium]
MTISIEESTAGRSVLEDILARLETRHPTLSANLVQFVSVLKAAELDATTTQLLSAAESLALLDVSRRDD